MTTQFTECPPEPFGSIARSVKPFTYLGLDRLYTLWQAIEALTEQATAVAEVGVYKGGSARFLAQAMRALGREVPFYVCDTFRGHVEVDGSLDGKHAVGKQFTDTNRASVQRYLYGFPSLQVLEGDIRDTSESLASQQFGCVHLDVDVYPITKFCLEFFAPRLLVGGTIVVDDYDATTCVGVTEAVDAFMAAHPRFRRLHLLTGQAVLIPVAA